MNKSLNHFLFFLSYYIYIILSILNFSFFRIYIPSSFIKISIILILFLLVLKEIINEIINIKEIITLFLFFFLSLILYLYTNSLFMLPFFVFLYCSRNIKFESIAKNTIIISILLLIIIIFSAKIGLITNYISYSKDRIRNYLGFRYSLYPQILCFNITALILYLNRKKINIFKILILILINYWIYSNTKSRLAFCSSVILCLFFLILKYKIDWFEKRKVINKLLSFSFPILFIVCLFIAINYNEKNNFQYNVNKILEERISLSHSAISEKGIHLLGTKENFVGNGLDIYGKKSTETYNFVDCLYINLLIKYGLLFVSLFLIIVTISLYKIQTYGNYYLFTIIVVLAFYSVIDNLAINLCFNTFWFIIGKYLFYDNKKT